jgi:peptidoglycan/LPS O-acetylase OafA/YrhL
MRFDLLDGLRGLAAVAVMFYHYSQHNGLHWFGGAWVAVDLFFVLSGFVIAHSYGEKIIAGMTLRRFVYLRLARLGPLYVLGLVLGITAVVLLAARDQAQVSGIQIASAAALGLLWLPYFNDAYWPFGAEIIQGPIFPLNDPAWSLFFELFVNVLFYFFVVRFRRFSGAKFVFAAMALFLALTLIFKEFNPGWGAENFVFGFPRVVAEFFLGTLIYELRLHQRRPSVPLAALLTSATLLCFLFAGGRLGLANGAILAPLAIVALSAIAVSGAMKSACTALGEVSYPLYVIHFPLYRLAFELSDIGSLGPVMQTLTLGVLAIALSVLLARADKLVRQRLVFSATGSPAAPTVAATPAPATRS